MKDSTQTALTLEPQAMTPMAMIQKALDAALESGNGLAVANLILDQMKEQRDYEDRAAFQAALRRIQDELKPIVKDSVNPETHSRYASAISVDDAIGNLLKREHMTLSFEPRVSEKADEVVIVGILSLGAYSREYPLPMPADGKGPKGGGIMSRTHATGSAITYAKRYLKNMIFDLSFKERDDDGNAAAKKLATLEERAHLTHLDNIRNAGNKAELQRLYLNALKDAEAIGDAGSIRQFIAAKDRRLGEL